MLKWPPHSVRFKSKWVSCATSKVAPPKYYIISHSSPSNISINSHDILECATYQDSANDIFP